MTKHILKKEKGFVQIPNSILINPDISLKAKGVLALMLSLPDNWNFSIEGIAGKCKESRECISNAVRELESAGYIKRTMMRGDDGKIIRMEYEIFEEPCMDEPREEKPSTEKPSMDLPWEESSRVNNIKINKKENNNIIFNNTQSNHIQSTKDDDFTTCMEMDAYRNIIKKNIDYDILLGRNPMEKNMITEIVELMVETVCIKREKITIASHTYPSEYVRDRFLSIDSEHIEYVIASISQNTTKVANVKQYILAVIFNAPNTMDNFYKMRVNYDLNRYA